MPPAGPGSLAPWSRRFVALLVDWVIAQVIATGLLGVPWTGARGGQAFVTLGVFAVENLVLLATAGATIGHRLLGLQLRQARPGLWPAQVAIRTVLLVLVVPALVSGRDGRGLHDLAAGTVLVRR